MREARKKKIIKSIKKSDGKQSATELGATIVKMAFELVPGGGAIAELIDYGMAEMKEKRLREFMAQVKIDLEDLRVTLNEDYVKTADFAFLLEHILRGVSQNYQKEKLGAYRALLVNSLIRINVESDRKEYFLNILNSITSIHIIFLRVLDHPTKWAREKRIEFKQPATGNGPTPMTNLKLVLPKYEDTQIRAVMGDLYYDGLIDLVPNEFSSVMGPDLEGITNRLSPLGKSFVDFIVIETKPAS